MSSGEALKHISHHSMLEDGDQSDLPCQENTHRLRIVGIVTFDALLEKALAMPNPDDRRKVMADIEQILRDSGIIIQPYWRSVYRTHRKGVNGCDQHQALEQHFDKVWIES